MSSLRNAVQRRNHKERSQLSSRENRGLLEKHKDYVLRARDYNRKQKTLKTLRQKASFKNPDEFYFGMVNAKTRKGVHTLTREREQQFDHEFLKLLKTQDVGYVNYQKSLNAKKIEKLRSGLHFLEEGDEPVDEGDGGDKMDLDDEDDPIRYDFMKLDEEDEEEVKKPPRASSSSKPKLNHTIFVDTEEEAKNFDAAKHFDTQKELLHRKYNRPTNQMLETCELPEVAKSSKKREKAYKELAARLDREEQLRKAQLEMEVQKNLMGKGPKQKVGVDAKGLPIYKWKAVRKR
ncbi:small-subunit processome [Fimicolochytrium jonesii]|uniref:small-subunit processome n=1 Tax=Fimicolochytrium jonesii TaxID=1396493 RepID=UPI0022FE6E34|nr:small-subunit processome [Fimicolochytrium jonesii]KAI8821618.1 small-subunit processome [Fimicolochytrium jonesii]